MQSLCLFYLITCGRLNSPARFIQLGDKMNLLKIYSVVGTSALLFTGIAAPASASTEINANHEINQANEKKTTAEDPRKGDWRYDPAAPVPSSQSGLIAPSASTSGISTLALQFSPAGCYGQTDYAHQGGSGWTEASVHGRTKCAVGVNQVGVTTSLQKQGFFWWDTMASQSSSRVNSSTSYDASPHWSCVGWGSQNYRGISHHWSVEPAGTFAADTAGLEQRFSC